MEKDRGYLHRPRRSRGVGDRQFLSRRRDQHPPHPRRVAALCVLLHRRRGGEEGAAHTARAHQGDRHPAAEAGDGQDLPARKPVIRLRQMGAPPPLLHRARQGHRDHESQPRHGHPDQRPHRLHRRRALQHVPLAQARQERGGLSQRKRHFAVADFVQRLRRDAAGG